MSQQIDTTTIPLDIVNNVHHDHYSTSVPSSQFSYDLLKSFICQRYSVDPSLFSMHQAGRLKLVYKDDTNDDITISSDDELRLSLIYSVDKNPLKIYIVSDHGADKEEEEEKTYQRRRRNDKKWTEDEKLLNRYSKPRLYESLNIQDVQEIELYKAKLVELHKMGYKRSKFNLKMMLNLRNKDDFSAAFEEIKRIEEEREKKRKLRYEQKQSKVNKKRKEKICKRDGGDDEKMKEDSKEEEEGYENVITACFDSWPEEKYFYLFIDGNNLLYMTNNLRKNSLRRRHSKSEEIIVAAVQSFASVTAGLGEVNVMFDRKTALDEKVLDNGSKFFITSARPTFNTTDDAFIELTKRRAIELRPKSLHVTSDRGLTKELCKLGACVMKPKMFFSLVIKKLNDGKEIEINKWFEDIESKLDMNQNNNDEYQNNSVDYQKIYQTKALLQLIGRNGPLGHKALVVSLNDANLPTQKKNPHMTVLFYYEGFADDVFRFIDEERNRYMQNKECLSFSLSKWGGRSDKIDGELYNFCVHMREKFSQYSSNERPPHVEMR